MFTVIIDSFQTIFISRDVNFNNFHVMWWLYTVYEYLLTIPKIITLHVRILCIMYYYYVLCIILCISLAFVESNEKYRHYSMALWNMLM